MAGVNSLDVSGRVTAANLVGPLKDKPIGDLADAIKAGNAYVNVHSKANPGGEVRAQLKAEAPPAVTAPVAPRPPATGSGLVESVPGTTWTVWALIVALGVTSAEAMFLSRRRA